MLPRALAEPPVLSIRVLKFNERALIAEVKDAARATWSEPLAQVRYLAAYLKDREAPARTMVVESPYVDRHYLQEYVGFYATLVRPPPSTTTRIHFWSTSFDDDAWRGFLLRAADGALDVVQRELADAYLGYVVVRPVPACPIGRTLLRCYEGRASRCYAPAHSLHDVHLNGFTFRVPGLPFQQQDQGLGACATTALWSALARVMRADGGRAATPLDVARAVPGAHGQLIASPEGLELDQMTRAIRALGYSTHVIRPADDNDVFTLALKACVRSGIPVVLRIRVQPSGEVHAVTVVGMRESDEDEGTRDLVIESREHRVRSTGLTRLYLHDDRLGPYARSVLLREPIPGADASREPPLRIAFRPHHKGFLEFLEPSYVETAIIPLYPKIRTTPEDLIAWCGDFVPAVLGVAGRRRDSVRVEPFFALGGEYLANVGDVLRDSERLAELRRTALLSRYVGVLRFSLESDWFMDLVIDTTDVKRNRDDATPLLLATGADASVVENLRALRTLLRSDMLVV
ncbi:MAG: hypothetical protein M3Y87_03140 [Myxococcota bacterium]|nr:hypothetical protein [Myxococcota bacterium]